MTFPSVSNEDWRAQVEKELAGKSFEKTLVSDAAGVRIEPLYTEARAHARSERRLDSFKICVHADAASIAEELEGGADAAWIPLSVLAEVSPEARARTFFVVETDVGFAGPLPAVSVGGLALSIDPLADRARGEAPFTSLDADLARLAPIANAAAPEATTVMISTLPYHDAGGEARDELALALSTGVLYLRALTNAGLSPSAAARRIAIRVSLGRDTFVELAKVRALRRCWRKLLVAIGASDAPPVLIHGVCSSRSLTVHDPWVNMLRVTTQVFAGVLGGVDLVTPHAFDDAFGVASPLGRRVARNTGLVLREESGLGQVIDPAEGTYFFETITDTLAREAWQTFRGMEQDGGIRSLLESGRIAKDLAAKWTERLARIAQRKIPLVGTSEFASIDEKLPHAVPSAPAPSSGLPVHRDSEAFEAIRARAGDREAVLVTLGPFAESRGRAGFAASFFSAGGVRTRETSIVEKARIACICGTDERYAEEAVSLARALKAAGCEHVLLAGRPGALEADLRAAGVDGFIFVGCDVVVTLSSLVGGAS